VVIICCRRGAACACTCVPRPWQLFVVGGRASASALVHTSSRLLSTRQAADRSAPWLIPRRHEAAPAVSRVANGGVDRCGERDLASRHAVRSRSLASVRQSTHQSKDRSTRLRQVAPFSWWVARPLS